MTATARQRNQGRGDDLDDGAMDAPLLENHATLGHTF